MADPAKTTVVLLDYDKMPRKRFLDALKDHLVSGKSQVYSSKYAESSQAWVCACISIAGMYIPQRKNSNRGIGDP